MSGDFVSLLPAAIQPIVRSVLGQQQQSGVSGFLSQAQNLLGGGGSTGGLLGGMGNLFGQASQQGQNGLGSFLGGLTNSFGGSSNSGISSMLGLPSLPNLNGLNLNTITNAAAANGVTVPQGQSPSGFSGILNTLGINQ